MSQTAAKTNQHIAMLTAAMTFTMQTDTPGTGTVNVDMGADRPEGSGHLKLRIRATSLRHL